MDDQSPSPAAPRREWLSDLWRIGVILAFTLTTRAWVVSHTEVTSRDSIGFIRFALQLEDPPPFPDKPGTMSRADVLKASPQPPGYPAALLVVSWPVRAVKGTNCDSMVLAAQLTSVLASLVLVFPLYFLGKLVFDRQTAFVGTLIFQVLPACTLVTSDGLSDATFLLMAATALWFAALGFRHQSGKWFLAAGAVSGLAYLVRPEGLVVALAVVIVMGCCRLRGAWAWKPALARGGLLAAGLLAVGAPYAATIGNLTNKPTGVDLFRDSQPSWIERPKTSERPRAVGFPLATWYNLTDGSDDRMGWALKALAKEVGETSLYFLPAFAGIGIITLRRRFLDDAAATMLLMLSLCHIALLYVVGSKAGYVASRHTMLIVLTGSFFAAASFPVVGAWLARRRPLARLGDGRLWSALLVAAVILISVPAGMKRLHANRAGHKAVGVWLAQHIAQEDYVLDPFAWAEYYAGHLKMPDTMARKIYHVYIVLEDPKVNPHPRLHLMKLALEMLPASELVYHWPPDRPADKAKVSVFRFSTNVPRDEQASRE